DPAVVIREETFFGRVCLVDAGFWGRIDAIQPAPDARWYPPRRHNRSSARSWWRQRSSDPPATHIFDAPHLGNYHAELHLLGGIVRRSNHVDFIQHPR